MKKLHLICCLFFIIANFSYSQCPTELINFIDDQASLEVWPMDSWGNVEYKRRLINNRNEIKVDWSTLTNYGRYGINDVELKHMMYKAVIKDIIGDCNYSGTQQFVFFEETECKIIKKCHLKVVAESKVLCEDTGWPGPPPSFFIWNSEYYHSVSKEFVCGTQCCEYLYTVECTVGTNGGSNYPHIVSITKTPAAGSDCGNSVVIDCLTQEVRNCESTCE